MVHQEFLPQGAAMQSESLSGRRTISTTAFQEGLDQGGLDHGHQFGIKRAPILAGLDPIPYQMLEASGQVRPGRSHGSNRGRHAPR